MQHCVDSLFFSLYKNYMTAHLILGFKASGKTTYAFSLTKPDDTGLYVGFKPEGFEHFNYEHCDYLTTAVYKLKSIPCRYKYIIIDGIIKEDIRHLKDLVLNSKHYTNDVIITADNSWLLPPDIRVNLEFLHLSKKSVANFNKVEQFYDIKVDKVALDNLSPYGFLTIDLCLRQTAVEASTRSVKSASDSNEKAALRPIGWLDYIYDTMRSYLPC